MTQNLRNTMLQDMTSKKIFKHQENAGLVTPRGRPKRPFGSVSAHGRRLKMILHGLFGRLSQQDNQP
jgi:hypothetical protein